LNGEGAEGAEVAGGKLETSPHSFRLSRTGKVRWAPGGSPRALVGDHAVWSLVDFLAVVLTLLE
jgi:hypothetical protein